MHVICTVVCTAKKVLIFLVRMMARTGWWGVTGFSVGEGVDVCVFSLWRSYTDEFIYLLGYIFIIVLNIGFCFSVNCSLRWLPVFVRS
jgi:hypothetical protein